MIRNAIINGGRKDMKEILQAIEDTNAIAYTEDVANQQAQIARQQIGNLPTSEHREALLELTNFAIQRKA